MPFHEFIIEGDPVSKLRHRTTKTGHTFTPRKTANYENHVAWSFIESISGKKWTLLDSPVRLYVEAFWTVPKCRVKQCVTSIPRIVKPDASNVLKSIEDGLNGHAWRDDSKVYDAHLVKFEHHGAPYCKVRISWI